MSSQDRSSFEADKEKGTFPAEKGVQAVDGNTVVMRGLDGDSPDGTVHRNLKSRHLQMIAIGGTIGTGLFLGVGSALNQGGPGGVFLGYAIMGAVVYSMMVALGEMTTLYPVSGAFTHYAGRFVDPALGFSLGYNYWYSYAITLPTEITAAALVINFWPGGQAINPAVFISIFLTVIIAINFLGVRAYGEAEFWLSLIKVVTIIGLIILGICITAGAGPNGEPIGFRYWSPSPFQQLNGIPGTKGQFLAFWSTFVQAAFSYLGTEIVALTAAEAENPRRNVPKAIKRVFYRIAVFYIIGVLVIGLIVSPNDPGLLGNDGTAASPWVIAIVNAGIPVLPSIINTVILLSAFSAGNSDLYASSRTLYGLACDGKAPAIFRKCTKNGLPVYCLAITACFGFLAFMNVSTDGSTVFGWLANLSAITGLLTWAAILLSYLRFYYGLKAQGIDRSTFAYRAPFQPYASWFGLIMVCLVTFFNGYTVFLDGNFNVTDMIVAYITIVVFAILYVFWKFYKKTKFVSTSAMDFETGRRELDEMSALAEASQYEPKTALEKIWAAVM